jgi:hypothetical protein
VIDRKSTSDRADNATDSGWLRMKFDCASARISADFRRGHRYLRGIVGGQTRMTWPTLQVTAPRATPV